MTTDEALARLRPTWHLGRGDDFLTDEPGWFVADYAHDDGLWRLGWGKTVSEAIEAALKQVVEDEREQAERDADYARRKAAGHLTPLEQLNEYIVDVWQPAFVKATQFDTVVRIPTIENLVIRKHELDLPVGEVVNVVPQKET